MNANVFYLVIPCYNEEEVLPETVRRVSEKLHGLVDAGRIAPESRVLFVDDGSRDRTWALIDAYAAEDKMLGGLRLSRNRGHQNALMAGLSVAKEHADMVVSMDADLQDDIDAIDAMIDKYNEGCQIVYGVRSDRTTDTGFKRGTAQSFYKLMKLLGADIIYNHADYRLMSKRALEELFRYKEVNLFLRGVVPLIGFQTAIVPYKRGERFAGESKYPLKKMLAFAINGITSLSIKPIRLVTFGGLFIFVASLLALVCLLFIRLLGYTVQGWTTLMGSVWALGGIQLLSLGVIGEYVGKIYMETKARPHFVIEEIRLR